MTSSLQPMDGDEPAARPGTTIHECSILRDIELRGAGRDVVSDFVHEGYRRPFHGKLFLIEAHTKKRSPAEVQEIILAIRPCDVPAEQGSGDQALSLVIVERHHDDAGIVKPRNRRMRGEQDRFTARQDLCTALGNLSVFAVTIRYRYRLAAGVGDSHQRGGNEEGAGIHDTQSDRRRRTHQA